MKTDVVEELFRKYYNDALLYTLSLSKDKTLSEDIVSTAFYKALLKTDSDKDAECFKSWLFAVCRNEYFTHLRKSKIRKTAVLDENMIDDGETVVDTIIKDEDYRALYRAIELLPDAQRELVTLFYFENVPIKEIATIVGKSETNVKVSLCRARESLKKILSGKA